MQKKVSCEFNATPLEVAMTRRIQVAKSLLSDTDLPITDIAFRAGFRSIRRFNDAFLKVYGRPPSALRRKKAA